MSRTRTAVVRAAAVLAAAVLVAVLPACSDGLVGGDRITADFSRGTGLYPGSPVRVLGVDIGRVTKVANVDGVVRVSMELAEGTRLPADARATIIPLTLLGERYVQLAPAYRGGPTLEEGSRIPLARTRVPAEIDDLLRSLEDFMGRVDTDRASDVVTNLAEILDGRGAEVNDLIDNAAQTLDLLADEGDDIKAVVTSLRDLSDTLRGRTGSIESLIRNYELVTQVLLDNRDDLDGVLTQLDRAAVELTRLLTAHEDPLRDDVAVLEETGGTVAANVENLRITLDSTVKLFEAAGRADEARTNTLRANNQLSPELTSDILAARLRDRLAGICRRLGIPTCSDPASPMLNELAALLPTLLSGTDEGPPKEPPAPSQPPSSPPAAPQPTLPPPPDAEQLLAALADHITGGLDEAQLALLRQLDTERLAVLLGVDPVLLQILPDLDRRQIERLRTARPEDIPDLMLALFNEVRPPATNLDDPLLPPPTRPPVPTPTLPPLPQPTVPGGGLPDPLGGN